MFRLTTVAFALAVLLVTVSAYIRLSQGGLGCTPWPECYARVGGVPEAFPMAALTHRLSASTLGVLVLLLNIGAWKYGKQRMLSAAILAVTALLAALGLRSGDLLLPAVVLGNFFGGLVLTTLLGWSILSHSRSRDPISESAPTALRTIVIAMLLLGVAVIATGIGSSAFYGNAVCTDPFDCGALHSPAPLAQVIPLALDATGRAIAPDGAATLHWAHRLLGATTVLAFAGLMFAVRRGPYRISVRISVLLGLVIVSTSATIGLLASRQGVPIGAAVIHSLSGLFVLLLLLHMLRRHTPAV
ncbi:MAG: COX15/CtaA family protein [Gammaproteobacteria bacterium]|nr:COX15/CtaA family protein [Gammaproteobacteria bacterium]